MVLISDHNPSDAMFLVVVRAMSGIGQNSWVTILCMELSLLCLMLMVPISRLLEILSMCPRT